MHRGLWWLFGSRRDSWRRCGCCGLVWGCSINLFMRFNSFFGCSNYNKGQVIIYVFYCFWDVYIYYWLLVIDVCRLAVIHN